MTEEMKKAVEFVVEYAKWCGECNKHWVHAKNYAISHGVDKETAKAAALFVAASAEEYGVIVKMEKHGQSIAAYFAGEAK